MLEREKKKIVEIVRARKIGSRAASRNRRDLKRKFVAGNVNGEPRVEVSLRKQVDRKIPVFLRRSTSKSDWVALLAK